MQDEDFARSLYADWDAFCQRCVIDTSEAFFSRFDSPDIYLEIDRLDLELGGIPQERFHELFPVRFREALERSFTRRLMETGMVRVGEDGEIPSSASGLLGMTRSGSSGVSGVTEGVSFGPSGVSNSSRVPELSAVSSPSGVTGHPEVSDPSVVFGPAEQSSLPESLAPSGHPGSTKSVIPSGHAGPSEHSGPSRHAIPSEQFGSSIHTISSEQSGLSKIPDPSAPTSHTEGISTDFSEGSVSAHIEESTPDLSEGRTFVHSEGSIPAHTEGSSPVHTLGSAADLSEGSVSGHIEENTPELSEGSTLVHSEGSKPAHSEGRAPVHPEGSASDRAEGSIFDHSERSTPARTEGTVLGYSEGSAFGHTERSAPDYTKGTVLDHNEGSVPGHTEGSAPGHSDSSFPGHSERITLCHSERSEGIPWSRQAIARARKKRFENLLHYLEQGFCQPEWDAAAFDLTEELTLFQDTESRERMLSVLATRPYAMERLLLQTPPGRWEELVPLASWLTSPVPGSKEKRRILSLARSLRDQAILDRPLPSSGTAQGDSEEGKQGGLPDRKTITPEYLMVPNAGLCLLALWFPRLFGMLGFLTEDRKGWKDDEARIRAVFLLQRLVTDEVREYKEHELAFNRILTGCPFYVPLPKTYALTENEIQTAESMLSGVKANWDKLKNTSVKGFQHSFLQRPGRLERRRDRWILYVESRAFDILLDSLPWSYHPIRLPWLEEKIAVLWRNKEDSFLDSL